MKPFEDFEKLRVIGENLRTQDNRITANPVFIVQQRQRDYGFDEDWTCGEGVVWIEDGEIEHDLKSPRGKVMERKYCEGKDIPETWRRTVYKDRWEFVTACFTEQGCKDYIAANGHNLKEPRIYVESGYRNREWETLRDYLSTH